MKRILIILAFATLLNSQGLCHEASVPLPVLKSFDTKFSKADGIRWIIRENAFKAMFVIDDQYFFAIFNSAGKLKGVGRNVCLSHLPLFVRLNLSELTKGKWLTELVEMQENGVTSYYAILENGFSKFYYKSGPQYSWVNYKTREK